MNEVRRAAKAAGLPPPTLSFIRIRGRECLQISTGHADTAYDGLNAWQIGGTGPRWRIEDIVDPDVIRSEEPENAGDRSGLSGESDNPEYEGSISPHPDHSTPGLDHPEFEDPDAGTSERDSPEEDTDFAPGW